MTSKDDTAAAPLRPGAAASRATRIGKYVGWRTVVRRLVGAVVVVWGAATLAFLALNLTPGDPARTLVGAAPATSGTIDQIRADLRLDDPWPLRYLFYLGKLLRGDLGTSYQQDLPVSTVIRGQLGATVQLTVAAAALAVLGALVVALVTAHRRRGVRSTASVVELVLASTPTFWLGVLLLVLFSFTLHIFPVSGNAGVSALVLPAVTLALPIGAMLSQVLRESLEDVLERPFVLTARARGMRETGIRLRHALRHAALPLVTLSGLVIGHLLGGAVIIEMIFARQGVGRIALAAIEGKDFPVVIAVVVLSALVFVVVNLIVDLICLLIDPRLAAEPAI
ncbi:ABC transporter permease [Protofrankia symbiont of Coriaria ruscifolia]|uniref:ABC transporter permease n=1 Tax=Protofrankia symbiont of Coriaria ruscifolia TaxID=1306542 RepID=UPI002415872D|nr:ABC transporter permease [Protofrankia symbiont of Coriaria ruscifolia]